ncbi:SelB C-terminal domain-containing protein, partial [Salmonella enterica subsp. enterica serovar Kentucky]|nr:SelB C-terminal domain-containing protein [Salmonella enterica subsp. enterica serovar Kentucky]
VVIASLIGTAIEFFDFYIYATAAVIVFPLIFFPQGDPTAATLSNMIRELDQERGSTCAADFRDRLNVGRKLAIQILEYFDRIGFT